MQFKLLPKHCGLKSFWGKAIVHVEGGNIALQSYYTIVASYNKRTKCVKLGGYYSSTTSRHIWEFLDSLADGYECNTLKDSIDKIRETHKMRTGKEFLNRVDCINLSRGTYKIDGERVARKI